MKWILILLIAFAVLSMVFEDKSLRPLERGCTTDQDCMEKYGGDGGPEPVWFDGRAA